MFRFTGISLQSFLRRPLVLIGLLLVVACTQGRAQSTQGSIVGTIKDAAGAMVPAATVTLTNTDEGTVRAVKSNAWAITAFRM